MPDLRKVVGASNVADPNTFTATNTLLDTAMKIASKLKSPTSDAELIAKGKSILANLKKDLSASETTIKQEKKFEHAINVLENLQG